MEKLILTILILLTGIKNSFSKPEEINCHSCQIKTRVDLCQLATAIRDPQKMISLDSLVRGPKMTELVVKCVNNFALKLFYVLPVGWKNIDKRAVVVWIHGGSWSGGSAESFFPHARYFASRGAVGFSVEYRLVKKNGSTVSDCLADCKSAIRYLREHANELGIYPNKIIVMGDSAGGHLASCLGTVDGFDNSSDNLSISARPNAMVLYNPLSDFTTSNFIKLIIGGDALLKDPSPESLIPDSAQLELAKKLSPLYNVRKNQPPILVLHGMEDKGILPAQSEKFTTAMQQAGNNCRLLLLPNTNHGFINLFYKSSEDVVVNAIREADQFLISLGWLKGAPSLVISKRPVWIPKSKLTV